MKKMFRTFAVVCFAAMSVTACKKDMKDANPDEISTETLAKIEKMGFSTYEAKKIQEGYLVEGDIILRDEDLSNTSVSPYVIIGQEEQYRTTNLVNLSKHSTIQIALNSSSANHDAAFSQALQIAVARYNAENPNGFSITFQIVDKSQPHDVEIVAFYENSNVLGSAGFPNSTGDPYNQVRMNTYHYSTATTTTNLNYIATIMAHEVGHCIGFRHTDYMDRSFSCGGRKQNEEKPFASGYGAIHISGTPTTPDAASWMLACIGNGVNRPFNANDKIALKNLY